MLYEVITYQFRPFQTEQLENTARQLSAVFLDYPAIYSSRVTLEAMQATVYFVNTEGTEVQFPFQLVSLTIQAGSMTDDSDPLNKVLHYLVNEPKQLPDTQSLIADIRAVAENIMALQQAPRFDDA